MGYLEQIKIRPLEGIVGGHIAKGSCVGYCIFHIDERLIAQYMKKRNIPADVWNNVVSRNCGNTSKVLEVYSQTH